MVFIEESLRPTRQTTFQPGFFEPLAGLRLIAFPQVVLPKIQDWRLFLTMNACMACFEGGKFFIHHTFAAFVRTLQFPENSGCPYKTLQAFTY